MGEGKQTQEQYEFLENTYSKTEKDDVKDKIEVEIGDSKQLDFYPQFKLMRWDNEVNFSIRLLHNESNPTVKEEDGKIKWQGKKIETHFYDLPVSNDNPEGGYEVDVHLLEKPDSNKIEFSLNTKDLKFERQPAFTEEPDNLAPGTETFDRNNCYDKEGNLIAHRPERIIGSYAVFASVPKYNFVDGKRYGSGKVGHIPKPRLVDYVGKEEWGEIDIDVEKGKVTVTIPQDFLDNAVYPIRHAAGLEFGFHTIGNTSGRTPANYVIAGQYALGEIGTISEVVSYGSGETATVNIKTVLYDDSANYPANKDGNSGAISCTTTAAWHSGAITALESAANYWLGFVPDANYTTYYDSTGGLLYFKTGAGYYTTPPNPYPAGGSTRAWKISAYATYNSNANSDRSAKTTGKDSANSDRSAKITGKDSTNSVRLAKTTGDLNSAWELQYEANELPVAATPAWTENFNTGIATFEIISGKLHIAHEYDVSGYDSAEYQIENFITPQEVSAVFEIKKKFISQSINASSYIEFDYRDRYTVLSFNVTFGIVALIGNDSIGDELDISCNLTDDYHAYKVIIDIGNNTAHLYIDGVWKGQINIRDYDEGYYNGGSTYFGLEVPNVSGCEIEEYTDYIYAGLAISGTLVNSERSSKITGKAAANSERSAKITGKDVSNSERNSKVTGKDLANSERLAKLTGQDSSNSERSAKITGIEGSNSDRQAKLSGVASIQDERNAKLIGNASDNSERGAKIFGCVIESSEHSAKVSGYATDVSERGAKTTGSVHSNDERGAKLYGIDTSSAERQCKIVGKEYSDSERSAKITGKDISNSDRQAKLSGFNTNSSERGSKITGVDGLSAIRSAKITGKSTSDTERPAKITGKDITFSTINAKITGRFGADSERSAHIIGGDTANTNRSAKIIGGIESSRFARLRGRNEWVPQPKDLTGWSKQPKDTNDWSKQVKDTGVWTKQEKDETA
ncbi:MAG: hypothetical protein COY66_05010 [Candidatus Kerfeldbacteria bacterium CG_4_10_14_0_8_um_filter_42_10]|uniref:Uncharacterized protein n=1 Tax=Candidatus Kerfeldbacteria bacterium CG_4_10_14_0_8_um_filter_42_10 TaxID=2014248 RepID=A0A2M7RH49_9BACT|nr:MAG: hypothetical protein COY66_05010 [Candidatus Kerfeldbacteria bacterium CG_4_10_14_0_8_um_filter_42_10]